MSQFQTDIVYVFYGVHVSFVRSFTSHRGTTHRFEYSNGSCFDIGPGEVSQVKRWIPQSQPTEPSP